MEGVTSDPPGQLPAQQESVVGDVVTAQAEPTFLKDYDATIRVRAGVDSPTSPTLAGPYFRGVLIRWAGHHRTKSDQIDGWSVQLLSRLGVGKGR